MTAHPDTGARAEISDVERRSEAFRKELRLRDLVLTQLMYVVGSAWVGTAAKLGHSQLVFWSAAIVFYYLPQAAVVIWLNRLMPLEGGLYQWAKVGFNPFVGYLVAWNLWVYTIVLIPAFGLLVATNLSYVLGPTWAWLTGLKAYTLVLACGTIGALVMVAIFGLRVGKWVHNLGGLAQILLFTALIAVPFAALAHGSLPAYHPLAITMPAVSLLSLNIFGKMAMGALSGFEWVAIMAGECRNPARSIGRSVLVATPFIAIMFMLGTSAVVALVPKDSIDLISPIPQTLQVGLGPFGRGIAGTVVPILTLLLLTRQLGNANLLFTGNTRLPMVAGWDGLLPPWFTRLHRRYGTPVNSILFVGAVTSVLTLLSLVGVGLQEAFQLLDNAAGILYALAYLAMFALPLLGLRHLGVRAPLWLRGAALSGFLVTGLYVILSTLPIIDVASWQVFALKIILVVLGANAVGAALYFASRRTGPASA